MSTIEERLSELERKERVRALRGAYKSEDVREAEARVIAAAEAWVGSCDRINPYWTAETKAAHEAVYALRAAREAEKDDNKDASDGARLRCEAPATSAGVLPHSEASTPQLPAGWPTRETMAHGLWHDRALDLGEVLSRRVADHVLEAFAPHRAALTAARAALAETEKERDEYLSMCGERDYKLQLADEKREATAKGQRAAQLALDNCKAELKDAMRRVSEVSAALEEAKKFSEREGHVQFGPHHLSWDGTAGETAVVLAVENGPVLEVLAEGHGATLAQAIASIGARPSAQATREVTAEDVQMADRANGALGIVHGLGNWTQRMADALNARLRLTAPAALQRDPYVMQHQGPAPEAAGENGAVKWGKEQRDAGLEVLLAAYPYCNRDGSVKGMSVRESEILPVLAKVAPLFVAQPGKTRLRVRCTREYVVKHLGTAIERIPSESWPAIGPPQVRGRAVAEAIADAAIELLGQDAGTQRQPVKLPTYTPDPEEQLGEWLAREINKALDGVRKLLAEAGVEVAS
jgi:hypothetical protein